MVEKLRQLKAKSHMTNQRIAEKSNIPESTVARIFSGKTPNPSMTTVMSMVRAMGGSAADFMSDDKPAEEQATPEGTDVTQNKLSSEELSAMVQYYENAIQLYTDTIEKKDQWILRLFWCLAAVALSVLLVLIFDILNPGFGFVKY